ncbi:hypothetical protein QQP08_004765 [Theobroma cacao]|uniref:Uncharacterized protein n=1 Tax=Theobroma cacao TaxID=3641 RepID=A0A061FNM6_THECC|nr:Uncharacterized protein TCM_043049 [Theobroma cacao]WRX12278.1 hypothetical protein QQP08_004765 [Theobroma cacao]
MAAASSIKKTPGGFMAMFLATLILCQGFANAEDKQPTLMVMGSEMPHVGESTAGMPLYRSRSDPSVLIPESMVRSTSLQRKRSP